MSKLPHILVVPFPAQSHVTPLLEFSHQLVDHGLKVTFVNTESIHTTAVSTFLDHQAEKRKNKPIKFISVPDGLETMRVHVEKLIKKMKKSGEKIGCVVADANVGEILEVAKKFGIKRAAFWPASLGVLAFMLHVPRLVQEGDIDAKGTPTKEEVIGLPRGMPAMSTVDLMWSNDRNMKEISFAYILKSVSNVYKAARAANWMLCNSFNEIEPASHEVLPNILSVGPLLASEQLGHPNRDEESTCLTWLDQQPERSVTYLAFGSAAMFSQSQFNELIHGLQLVNRPFLWVFQPSPTPDLNPSSTDDLKDKLAHIGKVVDWAPQQKILAHPSIACFITHCGWNSTMGSISMGVPLLCWPYIADQFQNENYICHIWKVGLKFDKDENGIITSSEYQIKVNELLGNECIRSKAIKLKDAAQRSMSESGSSSKNFKDFIKRIKL